MTSRDLIRAMLRRWYVVVVGGVLSLGLVYVVTHQQGMYFTQFNVVLIAPTDVERRNSLEDPRQSLYPLAGIVATDLNGGEKPLVTASPDTTLIGEGVRRGVQVRVPNLGSQWRPQYTANYLDVQVADTSPEAVSARAAAVVRRAAQALQERQDEYGVVPTMRVTSLASTPDPAISYVSGSRTRAAGSAALLGLVTTLLLVYALEKRAAGRRLLGSRRTLPARAGGPGQRSASPKKGK